MTKLNVVDTRDTAYQGLYKLYIAISTVASMRGHVMVFESPFIMIIFYGLALMTAMFCMTTQMQFFIYNWLFIHLVHFLLPSNMFHIWNVLFNIRTHIVAMLPVDT